MRPWHWVLLASFACSSTTDYVPPGPPARIRTLEGSNQRAAPGTTLPARLVARIEDADGRPVPATTAEWAVSSGPGRLLVRDTRTDVGGKVTAELALLGEVGDVQTRVRLADDTTVFTYFVSYSRYPEDTTSVLEGTIEQTVVIGDDFFEPTLVTIRAGNAVRFVWEGLANHSVVVTGQQHGAFPPRSEEKARGDFVITFPNAGEWGIWCGAHRLTASHHGMVVSVRN